MTRAFVALPLPRAHRTALAAYVQACAALAPGYRWVAAENLHLTLRFLGYLEPDRLELVKQHLHGVKGAPFQLALGESGGFGSRSSPRVVWLGLREGAGAAAELAREVEAACVVAGLQPESRPFQGHVTLARARATSSRLPALPALPALDPWQVAGFELMESRLGRAGPTYTSLLSYHLAL